MELTPSLYNYFVRPNWLSKLFIHNILTSEIDFSDKRVLDFGSGTGSNCLLFKPSYYLGVDVDPSRVSYARKRHPDYSFMVIEGFNLPIEANSLNYVVIVAVLHHIPTEDLIAYIQEFRRVLTPDGSIVVLEPYYCDLHHFNNKFMETFDNGKFIRNEEQYLSLFEQGMFSPVVKKRFQKVFYNEILFTASPN